MQSVIEIQSTEFVFAALLENRSVVSSPTTNIVYNIALEIHPLFNNYIQLGNCQEKIAFGDFARVFGIVFSCLTGH